MWRADNGQDAAWIAGGEVTERWTDPWIARARFAAGPFNAGGDVEDFQELRLTAGWHRGLWEAGAGVARLAFDTGLQPGWEWAYDAEEAERNADLWGPVVYGRAGGRLGIGPLAWHVAALCLPADFGDLEDLGYDGAHLDLEAALGYDTERLEAGAGYRWIGFRDMPPRDLNGEKADRDTIQGVFAFITLRF